MKAYTVGTSEIICNNKLVTYTYYNVPSDNIYVIEKILEEKDWFKSAIIGEYTVLVRIIDIK